MSAILEIRNYGKIGNVTDELCDQKNVVLDT